MILWFVTLLLGIWILKIRIQRRRMYKFASIIPKPKDELPIIGVAHKFAGNLESVMEVLINFIYESMQHNGIMRLWLGPILYFILTNPVDLKYVLKNYLENDDLHRFLKPSLGNGILLAPVSIWRSRRRILMSAFTSRNIDSAVDILSNQSETLANVLESKADTKMFEIWPHLVGYNFDAVSESMTGFHANTLKNENSNILESSLKLLDLACERMVQLWLQPDCLYKLLPKYQEQKKYLETYIKYADTVVEKVRADTASSNRNGNIHGKARGLHYDRTPFVNDIIAASGGTKGYSNVELREELTNVTAAATDPTAITVGNVLTLLAKYPKVQEKLYEELYEVFGDSSRLLVKEDLSKLEYMTRVIKETLRLFPPAPILVRKVLEDVTLPSGKILPAGTGVACCIFGVHRDPAYWGPDADHFDPDRFLPERFNSTQASSFIPFSYGPRNCVGIQYAMVSMKTALAAILRRFRVVGDKETKPVPTLKLRIGILMKAADGYQVTLEKRFVPEKTSK